MSLSAAMDYVRDHGTSVEQERMHHVMTGEPAPYAVIGQAAGGQNADGGWSASWSLSESSLDATCYRLATIDQLGIRQATSAIDLALDFIASRITPEGWLEEADGLEVPAWLAPGVESCRAYLSSNCAFWLTAFGRSTHGQRIADWIEAHLDDPFEQTRWLTAGLFWQLGRTEEAEVLIDGLLAQAPSMASPSLAWMGRSLLRAGIPSQHPLLFVAAERLEKMQFDDGGWSHDSSPNVHATIEAAGVLRAVQESMG